MSVVTAASLFTAATEKNADLEDLVDDFVTFFVAGMYISKCLYPEAAYSTVIVWLCNPGQETTSTLLTFTVILLHQNPEVLQR